MAEETMIVGDPSSRFLFKSSDSSQNNSNNLCSCNAVALEFAREKDKPRGEIRFQAPLSYGIVTFGPLVRTGSVSEIGTEYSLLSVYLEEQDIILDGHEVLNKINEALENCDVYIGVTQIREYSIGRENPSLVKSLAFYEIAGAAQRGDIMVIGVGIHPGDPFLFYNSDSKNAVASRELAFERLLSLKTESTSRSRSLTIREPGNGEKGEMFGGFVFSSTRGGESLFGEFDEEDSFQFSHHFAGIPFAGVFCSGQISRDMLSLTAEEKEEEPPCCLHVSGSVYLAMTCSLI